MPIECKRLLQEAALAYASPRRPSMAACHLGLRSAVAQANAMRGRWLPPIPCPSASTLRRAIGRLDPFEVHAARHGRASAVRCHRTTRAPDRGDRDVRGGTDAGDARRVGRVADDPWAPPAPSRAALPDPRDGRESADEPGRTDGGRA